MKKQSIVYKLELNIGQFSDGKGIKVECKSLQQQLKSTCDFVSSTFNIIHADVCADENEFTMIFDLKPKLKGGGLIEKPPIEILNEVKNQSIDIYEKLAAGEAVDGESIPKPVKEMLTLQMKNKTPREFNEVKIEALPRLNCSLAQDLEIIERVRIASIHFDKMKIDVCTVNKKKYLLEISEDNFNILMKALIQDRDSIFEVHFKSIVDLMGCSTGTGVVSKLRC